MKQVDEKEFTAFLNALAQLNPIEFLGVATLLKVPCFEDFERTKPRATEEILSDLMDNYIDLSHTKRKQVYKQIRKAGK